MVAAEDAAAKVQKVEGDGIGVADTGPRVWRAAELVGDHARLRDGEAFANYGHVDASVVRDSDSEVAAVLVSPHISLGAGGYYACPYYGYGCGDG